MHQKIADRSWTARLFAVAASALTSVLASAPVAVALEPPLEYPPTERGDVVDIYHGVEVPDPYRWLEQDVRESEQVQQWVEAQNKLTFGYLEKIPERNSIRNRLTKLWNYEKYDAPFKAGGRYYYAKNDGLQNQYVIYMQEYLGAESKVLFDPNTWSSDGTVALAGMAFSDDGRYVAYGVAEAGSDWNTWKIREIATGKDWPKNSNGSSSASRNGPPTARDFITAATTRPGKAC